MNREILFRGKRIDSGEWVQGYYAKKVRYEENYPLDDLYRKRAFKVDIIITTLQYGISYFEVDPKTVGQFTGYCDKNEVKIFEDDILNFSVFDHNGSDTQHKGCIVFSCSEWQIWKSPEDEFYGSDGAFNLGWVRAQDDEIETIDNIHDNPSLLKGDL